MDHFRDGAKMLEKSLADSGYTSELSTASESQISHRGVPIEEDPEIDENQEPPTPTTRNLQKFSSLQLTSPLKRPFSGGDVSPKKMCLMDENQGYETPKKTQLTRQKSSLVLSPISTNVTKSASKILGENQFENLSSTPIKSGFRPDFYVETVESVGWNPLLPKSRSPRLKRKLMRKIHSFSPRKWQRSGSRLFDHCPSPIPIDEEPAQEENPAQGIIAFNAKQFEHLLTVPNISKHSSTNEVTKKNALNVAPAAGREQFSSSRHLETVKEESDGLNLIPLEEISSHSIKEYFHEMRSLTEETSGTSKSHRSASNLSNIFQHRNSLELVRRPEAVDESHDELMDISLTPKQFTDTVAKSSVKGVKRSADYDYSPSVLQTPKKVRRSTSFQYSSDEEKHRILYPNLPCTPPKKRAKKSLDYSIKSPAKRTLDYRGSVGGGTATPRRCRPPKRNSYEGATTLNILSRLAFTVPALDRIFYHLRDEDLYSVYNVCRDWRIIIEGHCQAKKRLSVYQLEQIPIKENSFVVKKIPGRKESCERIHLRERNSIDEGQMRQQSIARSPPTSPSTRKYREHQKVLERLDAQAKVIYCPKCTKLSLIMSPRRQKRCAMASARASPLKRSPAKRVLFRPNSTISSFPVRREDKMLAKVGKSLSLPDDLSTFERELCTKNRSLLGDGVKYETYAICSRESCRFTFCTTCFRERHEVGKCVELEPRSPVRLEEEWRRRIVPGSKRSKRNLKRL